MKTAYKTRSLTELDIGKKTIAHIGKSWIEVLVESETTLAILDSEGKKSLIFDANKVSYIAPEHYKSNSIRRCERFD